MDEVDHARPAAPSRRGRWAAGTIALVIVALGACEVLGWPFLAGPAQRWLGDTLARRVTLSSDQAGDPKVRIRLLGGIRITAEHLEIGAPAWSQAPHMLLARQARITLGYADLWRASRGAPLRIRVLRAAQLDAQIERRADGRASWQFGRDSDTPDTSSTPSRVPVFGRLEVDAGTLRYHDALTAVDLDAGYSLVEGSKVSAADPAPGATAQGLQFSASGTYRKQPLRVDLKTAGVLPVIADDAAARALPVTLDARIGGARVTFSGTATDALHLSALKGRFSVQGPSLAAVGDPLHVTLPTTGPFRAQGLIAKQGRVWNTVIEGATIGSSHLVGAFTYDPRPTRPMLAGRLTGSKLLLADLGPAFGAPARASAALPDVMPSADAQRRHAAPGHVLPNREFDLPALRAMDANVLVDIDSLDLGSSFLEPLKPLRTQLVLIDGVLTLRELEARTGQGRLFGSVQLDGRHAAALWTADLRWNGVRLESWFHQPRAANAPPYATGSLSGQARVAGQGKSTAAILGSLRGGVRMQLVDGTISHLAVEAAGLDIAQGLGVLIKGDDALPVQCSVVDLVADQGLLKPRVLVLDTRDSTLWVDGSLSLASETLDLRVVTTPKDFSPLALRSPVRLHGSFADPSVSIEKGPLGARLGASVLLALVNPLAAVLPLMDIGNADDARRDADACRALSQRIAARPLLPSPAPAGKK
jgi:uncharacterized protein involved in outer membrane biogenesis